MTKQTEALKLALEALEYGDKASFAMNLEGVKANLRTAIEQAEKQEPLVTKTEKGIVLHTGWDDLPAGTPLYTTPPAAPVQEPVTILPDGSAFGMMSFPLPADHWLYAPNEYRDGEYEPIDLPKPILTHALREAVVAAVRYAVRGATMRGQEMDFDPDALVQNAVYALCGPYTTPPAAQRQWVGLTNQELVDLTSIYSGAPLYCAIEAKLREKNT